MLRTVVTEFGYLVLQWSYSWSCGMHMCLMYGNPRMSTAMQCYAAALAQAPILGMLCHGIRTAWCGDPTRVAQVVSPMRPLFARSFNTSREWASLGTGRDARGGFIHFPMPFWKSAKVRQGHRGLDDPVHS